MVGTRKLLRLAEHTMAARTKFVLIGDPCQLPEIEAGGAFIADVPHFWLGLSPPT